MSATTQNSGFQTIIIEYFLTAWFMRYMETVYSERKRRRVDDGQFVFVGEHLEGLKLQDESLDQIPSSSSHKRGIREVFDSSPDGNHKQSRSRLRNGVRSSSGTASIEGDRPDQDFDSENEDEHNLRSMNQLLNFLHVQRTTRRQLRSWEQNMSACLPPPAPIAVPSHAYNNPSTHPAHPAYFGYYLDSNQECSGDGDGMMVEEEDDSHTMASFP